MCLIMWTCFLVTFDCVSILRINTCSWYKILFQDSYKYSDANILSISGDVMTNEDLKLFVDGLDRLMNKHADDLKQLMDYILKDLIDSYDKLIAQRSECIDKYIKFLTFALQDERDINKPIQSLMDLKHNDIVGFQDEVAPIKEFKNVMLSDTIPSDEDAEKLLAILKNI